MREVYVFFALEENLSERDGDEDEHGDEENTSSYHTEGFRAGKVQKLMKLNTK